MKSVKTKFILSWFFLAFVGFAGIANATSPHLSVSSTNAVNNGAPAIVNVLANTVVDSFTPSTSGVSINIIIGFIAFAILVSIIYKLTHKKEKEEVEVEKTDNDNCDPEDKVCFYENYEKD